MYIHLDRLILMENNDLIPFSKEQKKEPLTLEFIEKNKMSGIDCLKYFNPDWNDLECDYYLWEHTCFPFSTEILITQLNDKFLVEL